MESVAVTISIVAFIAAIGFTIYFSTRLTDEKSESLKTPVSRPQE